MLAFKRRRSRRCGNKEEEEEEEEEEKHLRVCSIACSCRHGCGGVFERGYCQCKGAFTSISGLYAVAMWLVVVSRRSRFAVCVCVCVYTFAERFFHFEAI